MHITLRGLRFLVVGIIYPILGKVLFQISFTNHENILAHNTAMVTSGNSGLPRLNSSWKSSVIPLLSQSPIWVNPMGPITQVLARNAKAWQSRVTTCKLAAQNVLSLNACSYHAGSGHYIRDNSLIWLINMINAQCRPVFMSTKFVLSRVPGGVHVPPTTQWSAWRCEACTLVDIKTNQTIKVGQRPHDNWIT